MNEPAITATTIRIPPDAPLRLGGNPWRAIGYTLAFALAVGLFRSLALGRLSRGQLGFAGLAVTEHMVIGAVLLASAYGMARISAGRLPPALVLAVSVLIASAVGPCLWVHLLIAFDVENDVLRPEFQGPLIRAWLAILPWGLACAGWYFVQRSHERAEQLHRAQLAHTRLLAATAEARLLALQAQVEPHFLFNTLAHVKWLYRRDPGVGREMLGRLLDYLRSALPLMRDTAPTLGQEIELAGAYLDIQRIRIGKRLEFAIDVPSELHGMKFPPMMLITLVENAIMHGIGPRPEGGTVEIRGRIHDGILRVEVRDTGAGLSESTGTGIGLSNIRARLEARFGDRARLTIAPNRPHGLVAAIEAPC